MTGEKSYLGESWNFKRQGKNNGTERDLNRNRFTLNRIGQGKRKTIEGKLCNMPRD